MRDAIKVKRMQVGVGVAALLLIIGHYGSWAAHSTAALTLSANDLGFFSNYTPGAGLFLNEWFYLPVWVAAILVLGIRGRALGLSNRVLLGAVSLGVASLGLPRYEQLIKFIRAPAQALSQSDFTLQLVLTLAVMGLVVLLTAKTVRFATAFALGLAALLCAVPLAGYLSIRPFIAELYRDNVGIGIGWWLTLCADLLLWAMTFATIIAARPAHRNTHHPQ